MIVVGLYSPEPQSGKSTACKALATMAPLTVVKISGAMKAACAAAIAPFVDAAEMDLWVEGKHKDSPVPGLTPAACMVPAVVDALLDEMAGSADAPHLPFPDAQGRTLTRSHLLGDLCLCWHGPLEAAYAAKGHLTPRDLQKTMGLEWGRKAYGADFWIKGVRARLAQVTTPIAVVDDVRFEDDADLVEAFDGVLVRIWRPSAERPDSHASEGLLEHRAFAVRLDNDAGLDAYERLVAERLLPVVAARL